MFLDRDNVTAMRKRLEEGPMHEQDFVLCMILLFPDCEPYRIFNGVNMDLALYGTQTRVFEQHILQKAA